MTEPFIELQEDNKKCFSKENTNTHLNEMTNTIQYSKIEFNQEIERLKRI